MSDHCFCYSRRFDRVGAYPIADTHFKSVYASDLPALRASSDRFFTVYRRLASIRTFESAQTFQEIKVDSQETAKSAYTDDVENALS